MANPITDKTLMGSFEEKRELIRTFTMFDDTFFSVVMNNEACCEEALRVLTSIPDLMVRKVQTQHSIRNLGTHSVVLDVLAEDSSNRLYNIEIQNADDDDHQKRVRYYQSNIDISYLDKGKDYKDLPEVYLIYMTKFDLFKDGQTSYEIQRCIAKTGRIVDNGVHEIYVNAAVDDQTQIAELMKFFLGTKTEHPQFPKISKRIKYFKEDMEGVEYMCEAVERYGDQRAAIALQQGIEQGIEQGMEKGMQKNTQQVIQEALNIGLSLEVISRLVRLPSSEVKKIIDQLGQN